MSKGIKITLLIVGVLILDQILKIWIKTTMGLGDEFLLASQDWARIHFIENKGMAFGLSIGGEFGKLALSLFRIFAIGMLILILRRMMKQQEKFGLLVCFGLILAGAIGNMIDSAFYGLIFSESRYGEVATMFPQEGGYAGFLHGKVVDMFHFPMIETFWPEWVPHFGGRSFQFFRPIFNLADASISVGVFTLILFYRSFFSSKHNNAEESNVEKNGGDGNNKVLEPSL